MKFKRHTYCDYDLLIVVVKFPEEATGGAL